MTTGMKIGIGVAVVGAGAFIWYRARPGFGKGAVAPSPGGDPLTNPAIATIPILPDFYPPPPRPLGTRLDLPSGIGVIAAAGASMRGTPPPPPPPPPPPIEVATSVGNLWFPSGISRPAALGKVSDLAAVYASKDRPEGDDIYTAPMAGPAVVARSGRGHF